MQTVVAGICNIYSRHSLSGGFNGHLTAVTMVVVGDNQNINKAVSE